MNDKPIILGKYSPSVALGTKSDREVAATDAPGMPTDRAKQG